MAGKGRVTAQQHQVEGLLAGRGWVVVKKEVIDHPWWLDELWTIESSWSPVGQRAFVTFIVEPCAPFQRRRGEHVWYVAFVTDVPWLSSYGPTSSVYLHGHWEREGVADAAKAIEGLRE
jgi:hypothetical protein